MICGEIRWIGEMAGVLKADDIPLPTCNSKSEARAVSVRISVGDSAHCMISCFGNEKTV